MWCQTALERRALAAFDGAAVATDAPVFFPLRMACGRNGGPSLYPADWATVLAGALERRRAGVVVTLVEAGLDLRCPLVLGGAPLDTLVHHRFGAPALARIRAAAGTPTAADLSMGHNGCRFDASGGRGLH